MTKKKGNLHLIWRRKNIVDFVFSKSADKKKFTVNVVFVGWNNIVECKLHIKKVVFANKKI